MYNVAAYALFGNTWGQNPPGAGAGNFGFTGILVGERLFGPDDHPTVTLGGSLTGGYLHNLQVSPTGQPSTPPPPSTNLVDTGSAWGAAIGFKESDRAAKTCTNEESPATMLAPAD
jgi:hypothetical protein